MRKKHISILFTLALLFISTSVSSKTLNIGVFCATDEKVPTLYKTCAYQLGQSLAQSGLGLITGGANTGLMNAVMNGFASQGKEKEMFGIIPSLFKSYNVHHTKIPAANLIWTDSIYQRLQTFHDQCDAMVILPGGFGTLHELMDFLVPKQWGLANKKIVLLNIDHFWDYQLLQFKTMVEKNALQQKHLNLLTVVSSVEDCVAMLKSKQDEKLHTLDERYWEKKEN